MVNGTKAAKLGSERYFELSLSPGSYCIKADWFTTSGVPDREMTLQAEAGQTYYLCVLPSMHNVGDVATGVTVTPIYDFEQSIELMDGNVALPALRECSAVKTSVGADTLIDPR